MRPGLVEGLHPRLPQNSGVIAIPAAGHFLQLDAPETVADTLLTYFAGCGAGS